MSNKSSVFLANLHYFFAQTDGTYKWPNGAVGDLLKQAKKELEAVNVYNKSDGLSNYYVEGQGWFVVRTKNQRMARSIGVKEYGRGNVRTVRIATLDEVREYLSQKGEAALHE